jgi:hypothetical protein
MANTVPQDRFPRWLRGFILDKPERPRKMTRIWKMVMPVRLSRKPTAHPKGDRADWKDLTGVSPSSREAHPDAGT